MSRQRDQIDSIMVRNIYRFSLCPMIWASLSSDERNVLRSLAGETQRAVASGSGSGDAEGDSAGSVGTTGRGDDEDESTRAAADAGATRDESNLAKQALTEMIKDRPSQRVYELLSKKCEEAAAAQSESVAESGAGRILRSGRNFTANLETSRFVFEGVRDVIEVVCFSSAFLITGNLLASYSSSVVADVLFSSYQRGVGRRDASYSSWKSNMQYKGMEIMLQEPLTKIRMELEAYQKTMSSVVVPGVDVQDCDGDSAGGEQEEAERSVDTEMAQK